MLLTLFQINKEDGSKGLIWDKVVYTRNRNFRIILSSKRGQCRPLLVAEENKFDFGDGSENASFPSLSKFKLTLVSAGLISCPILPEMNDTSAEIMKVEGTDYRRRALCAQSHRAEPSATSLLDRFVLGCALSACNTASLGKKTLFEDGLLIKYDIKGSRFCQIVNREHKSNHIYFLTNLKEGTVVQKCYDIECRYRFHAVTRIPTHVLDGENCPDSSIMDYMDREGI